MAKILVAKQNVEQNTTLCQYLANDNNLKIIGTSDRISTLIIFKIKDTIEIKSVKSCKKCSY